MRPSRPITAGARRRALLLSALSALLVAVAIALSSWGEGMSPAAGATSTGEATPQTDASVPAERMLLIGASPGEAPGETWGVGTLGLGGHAAATIVRYESGSGWRLGAPILDGAGQPLNGFVTDENSLAGSVTDDGSGALLGRVPTGAKSSTLRELLLVRSPGHPYQETSSEPPLAEGERLFNGESAPMLAALEEGGGVAGALLVPVGKEAKVLHWNGSAWSSEPIELPQASKEAGGFKPLAIAASSPSNAWLLARLSSTSSAVALFRRVEGAEGPVWEPASPAPGAPAGAPLEADGEQVEEVQSTETQLLTVTGQGVWVDGERPSGTVALTLFFKPKGEEPAGEGLASWCDVPQGAPAACAHELPEPLPIGASRSFAWPDSSDAVGQRVITGLSEGDSLRLEAGDEEFALVLAKGAGTGGAESVGRRFGAAFSSPTEGWLGNFSLPVHLTAQPEADRLEYFPVPFHLPLLAIAPQPGAPVGGLSSRALAVGVEGQVARFLPGSGWQPEGLLNTAGRRETPELRAVAWPSPGRAYAVGVPAQGKLNQMWVWRGETGLWEPDPAEPLNLRANLLGIAFDGEARSRGYVVGQQGALLRYGKTWAQEPSCEVAPQPCLPFSPAALAKTSFTSVAFAGSQALVAYRTAEFDFEGGHQGGGAYSGGILANDGSGWRLDTAADEALAGDIPWAVAGLPDGGAAVSAESAGGGQPVVLERESPEAPWHTTPQPYPGATEPGSLALFREGGALRVIGSGGAPNTVPTDSQPEPPAGAPPNLAEPYPLAELGGYVLRQTATGWRDEEHEHSAGGPPPGQYEGYDEVYEPDPIAAVLVNESATAGWGVGGVAVNGRQGAETADIVRYPAEGPAPVAPASVPVQAGSAIFAIGGGAQCRAPCALRARAGIGPDVWLDSALRLAGAVPGMRAFLYAGPRISTGRTEGAPLEVFPYGRELGRYAGLLGSSPVPVLAASTPSELAAGDECPFEETVSSSLAPLGAASPQLTPASQGGTSCGSAHPYYSYKSAGSSGATVRVIVLDESAGVEGAQEAWLAGQLESSEAAHEPAILLGSAEMASNSSLACLLVRHNASAYFFYAPEQDVSVPVRCRAAEPRQPAVPAYGTGTLGYVLATNAERAGFIGDSGVLIAQVGAYEAATKRAAVQVQLTPDIGELALEAKDGTLLRRSNVALFAGLARRPRAGNLALLADERRQHQSDSYIPIGVRCQGVSCERGIEPEATFTSSEPSVGSFVRQNLQSGSRAVLLNSAGKPEEDRHSPLFCAFNPGETNVTITSGGLAASLEVVVLGGSVRQPCGTVPAKLVGGVKTRIKTPELGGGQPSGTPVSTALSLVPPPPPSPAPAPVAAPVPFVFSPSLVPVTLPVIVPPPVPAANPTPPSGTSPVTSPVEAAQREEDREEATESVSNQAVAYHPAEHDPAPAYLLGLIVLAAFAGATARRRSGRGKRGVSVAHATVSSRSAGLREHSARRRSW